MSGELPGFTVLMPTYNSSVRIRRCLASIAGQDYPSDWVQIIVADGGSTDDTREVAREYGAVVVDNPLRLAEEGLRVGMAHVRREYLVIFADDNELVGEDWFKTVECIFKSDSDLSAFWCRLAASADDPEVNKYYSLIQSEPLNFYLNRNIDRYMADSPRLECAGISYHKFRVDPARPLIWGANGLTFRTADVLPVWDTDEYLGDNDAFQEMVEGGHDMAAYSEDLEVYHHHVSGLFTWRQKWGRNFEKHFLGNFETRNLNWLFIPHFNLKLAAWTLYSLVPVASIPVAAYRALRDRDWHWLYHPAAAFLQASTYLKILLVTPQGRSYLKGWVRNAAGTAAGAGGNREPKRMKFDEMADSGDDVYRQEPHCLFAGRLVAGADVLDAGCWTGELARMMAPDAGSVTGLDVERRALDVAREKGEDVLFVEGSVLELPFADGSFDLVTFIAVIEHIPIGTERRALEELFRVLKPGGTLVLCTPYAGWVSKVLDPGWLLTGHRHYGIDEVTALLNEAGFQVSRREVLGGWRFVLDYMAMYFYKYIARRPMRTSERYKKAFLRDALSPGFVNIYVEARKAGQ